MCFSYARGLSRESEVVESGDAEHGLVDAVAAQAAVAEDFEGLHPGEDMFHSGSGPAVDGVVRLLFGGERPVGPGASVE